MFYVFVDSSVYVWHERLCERMWCACASDCVQKAKSPRHCLIALLFSLSPSHSLSHSLFLSLLHFPPFPCVVWFICSLSHYHFLIIAAFATVPSALAAYEIKTSETAVVSLLAVCSKRASGESSSVEPPIAIAAAARSIPYPILPPASIRLGYGQYDV